MDGHVKASRAGYREYIAQQHLERYDDQVRALEASGLPDAGNRLVDFCAEMPERRRGQMTMDFTDIDQAVKDVHWASEHGLGGISLPGMNPGDRFF